VALRCQIIVDYLERRNHALSAIRTYIRRVEHFARYFHRPPGMPSPSCPVHLSAVLAVVEADRLSYLLPRSRSWQKNKR
jgi:hypothetical protein